MNKITQFATLLFAVAVILSSCGKYEDGPGLSLRSKKARLAQEWEMDEFKLDGIDYSSYFNSFVMDLDKNGDFSIISTDYDSYSYTQIGEWEFSNDKEEIQIKLDDGDRIDMKIDRLTNKELWVEYDVSYGAGYTERFEIKFESK